MLHFFRQMQTDFQRFDVPFPGYDHYVKFTPSAGRTLEASAAVNAVQVEFTIATGNSRG